MGEGQKFFSAPTLQPGDVLDGFVLREVLGSGGAAVVFEAWEEKLRRTVAIKLPKNETGAETILSEGQALAAFRHEGLPIVYAMGDHEGVPYLVLERLRGHPLSTIVDRHGSTDPLPWREALHYLSAIAEVLQVLHRADLTHRDVKPANIMACPNGRVVLIDMGILQQERDLADEFRVSGTPCYIAPEALTGSVPVGAGHFLDIYALGVVAFELLTGELPYYGATIKQLLHATLHSPVPRVSDRRREIPAELDDLIHALLAKDSTNRPHSIEAVLHRLRAIAEGKKLPRTSEALSVLMVDDDPDYHELMRSCSDLFSHKIDLRLACDGINALEMIRDRPCDLLLVDLEMPNMNGFELCMYLRSMDEAKNTLVAVLSGKSKPNDRALLSEIGVMDFIDKSSLELEEFVDRINQILDRSASTLRNERLSTVDDLSAP